MTTMFIYLSNEKSKVMWGDEAGFKWGRSLSTIIVAIGVCVGIAGLVLANIGIIALAGCIIFIGGVPLILIIHTLWCFKKWRKEDKERFEAQQQ